MQLPIGGIKRLPATKIGSPEAKKLLYYFIVRLTGCSSKLCGTPFMFLDKFVFVGACNISVPLRGRVCCNLFDTLFKPPAAHFFTQKSVEKALRGYPLKPHFTGVGNRLVISHNGTPSKKTSCVCPARTLLHSSLFLSAFASGCLHRRSSLQDNCKTRHSTGKAENFR